MKSLFMRCDTIVNRSRATAPPGLIPLFFMFMISLLSLGCLNSEKDSELNIPANFSMELENSKGERISMEEFRGKKIFFNVWATWCPPCIEEMPTIHNLHQSIGESEEVVFLMLTMDQDFQKAKDFRTKYGYNFEIYRPIGAIPAMYHTKLIPTTFVINSEGILVLQHDGVGEFDSKEFREYFASVK